MNEINSNDYWLLLSWIHKIVVEMRNYFGACWCCCCSSQFQLLNMCVCCGYYFYLLSLLRLVCCCCFCFCFSCYIPVLFLLLLMLHWQHIHTDTRTQSLNDHACRTCIQCMRKAAPTVSFNSSPAPASTVGSAFSTHWSLQLPLSLYLYLWYGLRLTLYDALSLCLCSALLLSPVDLLLLSVLTRWSGLTVIAAVWHLMVKFEHFFIIFFC